MAPGNLGAVAATAFLVNQFRVVSVAGFQWIKGISLFIATRLELGAPAQLLCDEFQVFLGLIRANVEFPGVIAGNEKGVFPAAIREQPAADARAVVVSLAVKSSLGVVGAQVQHLVHRVVLVFLILIQILHMNTGDTGEIFKLQEATRKDKPMNLHRCIDGDCVAGLVLHTGDREAVNTSLTLFAGGQHHG